VNVSGGNDENKKRLGTLGACAEIVNAMQAFPSDKTVQLQGAWVLAIVMWCPWPPLNPKAHPRTAPVPRAFAHGFACTPLHHL
jgi:hypothetical protein